jgi:predicted RNA-binding Zn-ribbon protein involved in translation (DUF1610 family)
LICPRCQSARCRRSRRHTAVDYLLGVVQLRPWRCRSCEARFYARLVPVKFWRYANCPRCGNLNLERLARERIHGAARIFLVSLGMPAYRCDPCRHRFVTWKPLCNTLRLPEPPASEDAPEPAA